MYISTSVWVLYTPKAGWNMLFQSFLHQKALDQRSGANLKTHFFAKLSINFLALSSFFSFLAQKMLKKHISTSIWSVQHPNAVQNIQHLGNNKEKYIFCMKKVFYFIVLLFLLCFHNGVRFIIRVTRLLQGIILV